MLRALYYPHTEIKSEIILKNALLLWDSVDTIVPSDRMRQESRSSKTIQDAIELIVTPRRPTQEERIKAHASLSAMMNSGEVAALLLQAPAFFRRSPYFMYGDKFLYETWRMLEESGLTDFDNGGREYGVPSALGFLMMSLLADICAGTQLQKITDRVDAYGWLSKAHAQMLGTNPIMGLDVSQVAPAYDRLVALSLSVVDARNISLDRLVDFRRREAKSRSTDYVSMRRRYLKALSEHIERVTKEAKSLSDLKELERQFVENLRDDLNDLKSELGIASIKTMFSKEVAVTALVTAGTLVSPVAGLTSLATEVGAIGIIPLLKSAAELRGARRTAFQRHTSSWLYLAGRRGLQVR